MKKIILLILIFMLVLVGCMEEEYPIKGQPTEETNTTILNLKIGETAKTSKLLVTIKSVETTDSINDIKADSDNILIIMEAEIKNIGSDKEYVYGAEFVIVDSEGYRYKSDSKSLRLDHPLEAIDLYPNQEVIGKVLFEVPKNITGLKIQYDFGFSALRLVYWIV